MADSNKPMLNLPLADDFSCTLKFDVKMPDPSPGPKMLFPPSGMSKLWEARVTHLNLLVKPEIYVPPTMHIDFELLTLLADERRDKPPELDAEEEEILDDPKNRKNSYH